MSEWLDRAMSFEPSIEMQRRLAKNRETFAQYVVRVMSYSCPTCNALPGVPCDEKTAIRTPGGQFHKGRAVAAKCPVTKNYYEPELDE